MVLYGITLVPLVEELREAILGLLSPFYADDTAFLEKLLKLLIKRGAGQEYFPELAKSLFILDTRGKRRQRRVNSRWRGLT